MQNSRTSPPEPTAPEDYQPSEIVYAELNLEKWPIWEPSSSKSQARPRVFKRERLLPDGSRISANVEVGFTQHGCLSTRDQKTYYVLLKLWDAAGRPDGPVAFSLQGVARLMGEEWGQRARLAMHHSLLRLRGVLIVWSNSYFDKVSGEHLELLDTFNILSHLTIARRTQKLHPTTTMCEFRFHERLLRSLRASYTTPLFLDTVLGFRSEIAQILYPRLDLILADKGHYERRTKELFEDLGLEAGTYRHRSARKRVLEHALLELQGVPVTTGRIASATVEPTKDNLDFKLVIRKGPLRKAGRPRKSLAPAAAPSLQHPPSGDAGAPPEPRGLEAPTDEPVALARYFHQVFHGASPSRAPGPKETMQANRLLEAHGLARAKALVDFAKAEADKTRYAPASLNGIVQYEGRFEADRIAREQAQNQRQERRDRQQEERQAGEAQQREIVSVLVEKVGSVREAAPEAFAAFIRQVEAEREKFLATPVARRASPEMQEMLSREYERPAKRLEIFVEFFQAGGQGEALLQAHPQTCGVCSWLRMHKDALQHAIRHGHLPIDAEALG